MSNHTLSFEWKTNGLAYGNYTLIATVEPLLEEDSILNNNCTLKTPIHIGIPGDISGPTLGEPEGLVDMRDVSYLLTHFNTNPGSLNWNPNCDIDNNGIVNIRDITIAILHFNQHE
jgi:hypothetical protein